MADTGANGNFKNSGTDSVNADTNSGNSNTHHLRERMLTDSSRSLIDSDSDLPALADASDCDASSDDASWSSTPPTTPMRASVDMNNSLSSFKTKEGDSKAEAVSQSHNLDGDGCDDSNVNVVSECALGTSCTSQENCPAAASHTFVSSQPRHQDKNLTTATSERMPRADSCGTLFCISEFLPWDGEKSSRDTNSNSCINPQSDHDQNDADAVTVSTNEDLDEQEKSRARSSSTSSVDTFFIQRTIEKDILKTLSCRSEKESIGYWVESFDHDLICRSCVCSKSSDVDADSDQLMGGEWNDSNMSNRDPSSLVLNQRMGNRNSCQREKARKRIMALRESGLNRNFSLSYIGNFLEEEAREREETKLGSVSTSVDLGVRARRTRSVPPLYGSKSSDWSDHHVKRREISLSTSRQKSETGLLLGMSNISIAPFSGSESWQGQKQMLASVPSFDSTHSEVELFYDSDPGAEVDRVTEKPLLTPRKYRSDGDTAQIDDPQVSLLQTFDLNKFDVDDSNLSLRLIGELASGSYSFIYHKCPTASSVSKKTRTSPPLRIKSWFELGSCLKTVLIQPKFIWRTQSPVIGRSRKQLLQKIQAPESVELLNVVRINSAPQVDRNLYPFVKTENSFSIVTNSCDEFLFEAKDVEEMKRFVFCMKLMIARLASKIIVGDRDVFDEFFMTGGKCKLYRSSRRSGMSKKGRETAVPAGVEVGINSEDSSVVGSICSTIVAPVATEGSRKDELWGR